MTDQEFRDWLDDEVANGRMTARQRFDLLHQKAAFDQDRPFLEQQFPGTVVGYSDRARFTGATVQEVLKQARTANPHGMMYFEPIGFDLF